MAATVAAVTFPPAPKAQTENRSAGTDFTAAQAARGKQAYASSNCSMCHAEDLSGNGAGPALSGADFKAQLSQSPAAIFSFMATQMPPFAAGSLGAQTYADIEAFLLQVNGFAPGDAEFAPVPVTATAAAPGRGRFGRGGNMEDAVYKAAMARQQAALDKITPVTDDMLRHPPSADWLIWRGSYAELGYSSLEQINKSNVNNLRVAWSWSLPVSANETTPLVHNGVIFIKSGSEVDALDGRTGDMLWRYVRPYPAWMNEGGTEIVKTLALYQDNLFVPFLDGHLVALNVKTGTVVWDHVLVGAREAASRLAGSRDSPDAQHYMMVADGGPIVAKGEVVVGLAGCSNDYKGGCFISGLNAETGQEDWRFNTIARPGQPGGDSWNGAPVDKRFGASVWFPGSYDPDLDLLYFGTGQTYETSTLLTPQAGRGESNDALYTDSTVAIVPETGKLAWYYQHFRADVWDLDWAFEQSLITLPVDGKPRNLVVTAGKIGIFDVLDRATGQYLFSKDLGVQNIVTSIDPLSGSKTIDPALMPAPGNTKRPCPFARDEPSTAFDPQTKIMYIPFIDVSCPDPNFNGDYGRLQAVDLQTKKILWTQNRRAPEITSALATKGGIVFDGSTDRELRASDSMTGKVLWSVRLNDAAKCSPVTYSIDGKQYIAVVAGGTFENQPRGTPETALPAKATTLWIFSLPDKNGNSP